MISPPTDRVVAIMSQLAASDGVTGRTIAEITLALELNRSTTAAVLAALESAGWVRRTEDRRYLLGGAVIAVGDAARTQLPVPAATTAQLRTLADAVGCGVTMSLIETDHLTVMATQSGQKVAPAGVSVGRRIRLACPAGASVMPWRSATERAYWLDTAPAEQRPAVMALLELVAETGVALWRPKRDDTGLLDVLAELLEIADDQLLRPRLRQRVLAQLSELAGRPYTQAELSSEAALPLSYLASPVFDADGTARYEVQLGPLRAAVPRAERERYIAALRDTTVVLSA